MEANYRAYDHVASASRIIQILDQSDINYEEVNSLPPRTKLTFTNGFYANCSAIFIDIRGSSDLPQKYKRPKLARLYRAFISEAVAIMNGDLDAREINVVGDSVWSVVNTPFKADIDGVFATAYRLNSMVKMLNCKSKPRGFDPITVGIGMSWGRALMVKAGLSGSAINDVVYMGEVVNSAAKLASYGKATWSDRPIMVSSDFHGNLNDHNKSLLEYNWNRGCYHGEVIAKDMESWYQQNCT